VCALLVPPSGLAAGVVAAVGAVYLAAALAYSRSASPGGPRSSSRGRARPKLG